MKRKKFDSILKAVAIFFKTIAHPDRIRLIGLLKNGEMDVSELQNAMGVSQSSVSQHLKILKFNGLVESRHSGKHHYYYLVSPLIAEVIISAIELQAKYLLHEPEMLAMLQEMKNLLV